MTTISNQQATIIRTERGLTIAGTRITLYDVMDHLKAGWTPKLIQNWLPLTDEQLDAAISYIDVHHNEVETEYQTVLQIAAENRKYWEEKNGDRFAYIATLPPQSGKEEIYAKLQAWKTKMGLAE